MGKADAIDRAFMSWTSQLLLLLIGLAGFWYSFTHLSKISTNIETKHMAGLQPLKFLSVAARAKHSATVIFVHVRLSRML